MLNNFKLLIEDLSYSYGDKAVLNNINWTLHSGNIYVLLGPNGAGKTTLLNLIANVITPTHGSIRLIDSNGENMSELLHDNIGYLTEFPYFYPFLTTTEMIRLVGQLKGLDLQYLENQIEKWIDFFGLNEYRNQTVGSLSQGTKKRVAFINAIIHQPKILLLDEPTNGLDPEQIVLFRNVLKELSKAGTLILLSTHIMDLAEKLADKIGIIRRHHLIYTGDSKGKLEDLYLSIK